MTDTIKRTHFINMCRDFNKVGVIDNHAIVETQATPEYIINRVSQIPLGWIKKKIYDADTLPERIEQQNIRLFDFFENGRHVGYCITAIPDKEISNAFLQTVQNQRPIEIENIALFPAEAGKRKGRGQSFLNLMQERLFSEGYGAVYLNTSETNAKTLPDWYRRMGMKDLGQDEVANFNNRIANGGKFAEYANRAHG